HIAVYVADARAQELPLVGGGEHDWAYLLGQLGLLTRDHAIARGLTSVGYLLVVSAAAWGLLSASRTVVEQDG
ncbi:MAG: zinc ribbon domain-containing protein, partial [Gemmatimonadota bacterium]|nr:zinc ribbon domain-containing protein [Gemmatimonadota bacterium]